MQDLNDLMWSYHDFTAEQNKPNTIEHNNEVSKQKIELSAIKPSKTKVISLNGKKVA